MGSGADEEKPAGLEDQLYVTTLEMVLLILSVQFNILPVSTAATSATFNCQVPFALPVSELNAPSGTNVPLNGAVPEPIGVTALIEKFVLTKLSPEPPRLLLR